VEEEIVLLEEQLAAAEASIEHLQSRLNDAESLTRDRERDLAEARRRLGDAQVQLGERQELTAAQTAEIESLRSKLEAAVEHTRAATQRYRQIALSREPELPEELVKGDNVDEIDIALERARQTVAQVRQHLEAQARIVRIPTGSPPRAPFDPSELSASEKIRLGLER